MAVKLFSLKMTSPRLFPCRLLLLVPIANYYYFYLFISLQMATGVESAKPYFALCNPNSEQNECGLNAVCFASSRCQMGRCLCTSEQFRPFRVMTRNGPAYGTDCARLYQLGENCTGDLDGHLIDRDHGYECLDGTIQCSQPMFQISHDGKKCVFSDHLKGIDNDCGLGFNTTCNPYLGLVCTNDTVSQTCRCPPLQRFFLNDKYPFGAACDFRNDFQMSNLKKQKPNIFIVHFSRISPTL